MLSKIQRPNWWICLSQILRCDLIILLHFIPMWIAYCSFSRVKLFFTFSYRAGVVRTTRGSRLQTHLYRFNLDKTFQLKTWSGLVINARLFHIHFVNINTLKINAEKVLFALREKEKQCWNIAATLLTFRLTACKFYRKSFISVSSFKPGRELSTPTQTESGFSKKIYQSRHSAIKISVLTF